MTGEYIHCCYAIQDFRNNLVKELLVSEFLVVNRCALKYSVSFLLLPHVVVLFVGVTSEAGSGGAWKKYNLNPTAKRPCRRNMTARRMPAIFLSSSSTAGQNVNNSTAPERIIPIMTRNHLNHSNGTTHNTDIGT